MRTSRISRLVAPALVAAAFAAGAPGHAATAGRAPSPPLATTAKSCGAGYTHAVIGGEQKCLRRGEFCAHRYNGQYHRYGYSCTRRDARGNYHLS
jgi:hypothetical protein